MDKNKLFIGLGGIGKTHLTNCLLKITEDPYTPCFLVVDSSENNSKPENKNETTEN